MENTQDTHLMIFQEKVTKQRLNNSVYYKRDT